MVAFIGDSKNIFAERMLERGYIPENAPPSFRIENLHKAYLAFAQSDEYVTTKVPTESVRFNASKRNRQRRTFSMPNPVFMMDAAKFFIDRADQIEEHFAISEDSCSSPVFTDVANRALKIDSFGEFYLKRRKKFAASRYIVKCDISRFYHSIYTHCIPWALHGKQAAKADRKFDSDAVFGNRLDHIIRQSQDGQTVGIPVGPDFSRLISEIVAVRIDTNFRTRAGNDVPALRLVDDIYIGADNLDEAYTLLDQMRDSVRDMELDLNDNKTVVIEASKDFESPWPIHIRQRIERFKDGDDSLVSELIHTLDEIISITIDRSDDGIIKYALRKMDTDQIWQKYWDAMEPFLVRCCISFPHSLDYVAQIVATRNELEGVDTAIWHKTIHKSLAQHVSTGHDFEVSWCLWLAERLKITIDETIFTKVFEKCSSIAMILALSLHKSCGLAAKVPKETVMARIGDKPCLGPHWLLAFEGDRQFGLKVKTKNLIGNEVFKSLYDDNVSFFDSEYAIFSDGPKMGPAIKKIDGYDSDEDLDGEIAF